MFNIRYKIMTKTIHLLYAICFSMLCLTITGCEKVINDKLEEIKDSIQPLPEDKYAYAGYWEGSQDNQTLRLWIKKNGDFYAQRISDNYNDDDDAGFSTTNNVHAPIQLIDDKVIVVGIMKLTTTYHINTPPHVNNDQWQMTIEGVTLSKKPETPLPKEFDHD